MNSEIQTIIDEFIIKLRILNLQFQSIYIFGDYALDKGNEHSRIKVAIILIGDQQTNKIEKELNKIKRSIDFRIDVYVINESNFNTKDHFSNEIIKTGYKFL